MYWGFLLAVWYLYYSWNNSNLDLKMILHDICKTHNKNRLNNKHKNPIILLYFCVYTKRLSSLHFSKIHSSCKLRSYSVWDTFKHMWTCSSKSNAHWSMFKARQVPNNSLIMQSILFRKYKVFSTIHVICLRFILKVEQQW